MSKRVVVRPGGAGGSAGGSTKGAKKVKAKPVTIDEVRSRAARVASGVAGGLNILGALSRAAGVVVSHVVPAGGVPGRGLDAIGEHLVEAARSLGAAGAVIGGGVVVPAPRVEEDGGIVDAEVVEVGGDDDLPPGRKPRTST